MRRMQGTMVAMTMFHACLERFQTTDLIFVWLEHLRPSGCLGGNPRLLVIVAATGSEIVPSGSPPPVFTARTKPGSKLATLGATRSGALASEPVPSAQPRGLDSRVRRRTTVACRSHGGARMVADPNGRAKPLSAIHYCEAVASSARPCSCLLE